MTGHAQRVPVQRGAVVADAAAGYDSAVAELKGGADPLRPAGRQRVHGDDGGGLQAFRQAQDCLGGLNAGGPQNAGTQRGHGAEAGKLLGLCGEQVPGDKNAIRCQRTYGVRRHGPISQSSYQNGPLLRQQLPGAAAPPPARPGRKIRRPAARRRRGPACGSCPTGFPSACSPASSRMSTRVRG